MAHKICRFPDNRTQRRPQLGRSHGPLRLKIYTPDNQCLGVFFDDDDGRPDDGRINIDICNSGGIAQGTWYYEVYGYSIEGIEDYYI